MASEQKKKQFCKVGIDVSEDVANLYRGRYTEDLGTYATQKLSKYINHMTTCKICNGTIDEKEGETIK